MDKSEAKQFLKGYRMVKRHLESIDEELREIRALLDIKGVAYNQEKVQSSTNADSRIITAIHKLTELEKQAQDMKVIAVEQLKLVKSVINKIENPVYQQILVKRYISGFQWSKIAEMMGYEYRYILKLHEKALVEVGKVGIGHKDI